MSDELWEDLGRRLDGLTEDLTAAGWDVGVALDLPDGRVNIVIRRARTKVERPCDCCAQWSRGDDLVDVKDDGRPMVVCRPCAEWMGV